MILKTLWRRRTRSLLTILGIAIGVAAVVALGAMARGMTVNYATSIAVDNDLLVIQTNAFDPLFSSLDEEDCAAHRGDPGRRDRSSRASTPGSPQRRCRSF